MSTTEPDDRTVMLKGVRLSFTDALPEKKKSSDEEGAKPKHGLNIIIETTGPYAKYAEENKAKVINAMKAAGQRKWKKELAYKDIQEDAPKRVFFRKGDKFKNKDSGQVYAGYEGNFAMSVSGPNGGQKRPRLIDRSKRILIGPGDSIPTNTKQEVVNIGLGEIADIFYSGTYADVKISAFGTDKGSRGIFGTCELIRSYQQGERMAGGYQFTDDDLGEMDDLEPMGGDIDDMDAAPSSKPSNTKAGSIDDTDDI